MFGIVVFALAFGVLTVSVLRSASPKYAFTSPSPVAQAMVEEDEIAVDYELPFPGRILPDNLLWPLKAFRDRAWHILMFDASKEAELSLLFSDKRLGMSKLLFERDKPELAFTTLTKGEKYLEEAMEHERRVRQQGKDTTELLIKISSSALKHRLVIDEILLIAPEDAKPGIIKTQDYSKKIYNEASDALSAKGIVAPKNPFDGD